MSEDHYGFLPGKIRFAIVRQKIAPDSPDSKVLFRLEIRLIPNSPNNQYPKTLPSKPTIILPYNPRPRPVKIRLPSHPKAAPVKSMMTISIMKL